MVSQNIRPRGNRNKGNQFPAKAHDPTQHAAREGWDPIHPSERQPGKSEGLRAGSRRVRLGVNAHLNELLEHLREKNKGLNEQQLRTLRNNVAFGASRNKRQGRKVYRK